MLSNVCTSCKNYVHFKTKNNTMYSSKHYFNNYMENCSILIFIRLYITKCILLTYEKEISKL